MDTSSLSAQCMGLHEELEGLGQMELNIVNEMEILSNRLKTIRFRKIETKKAIEENLDKQSDFWNTEVKKSSSVEDISALEDYLINPNRSIYSIAEQHGITGSTLTRQISEYLKATA